MEAYYMDACFEPNIIWIHQYQYVYSIVFPQDKNIVILKQVGHKNPNLDTTHVFKHGLL